MTARETTAFNAGIETMRQMALVAAVTLETRGTGSSLQHRAAVAALYGLTEGAQDLLIGEGTHETRTPEGEALHRAVTAIAAEPGVSGEIHCPACAGRLRWSRDSANGHLSGTCETPGCLVWMQ